MTGGKLVKNSSNLSWIFFRIVLAPDEIKKENKK